MATPPDRNLYRVPATGNLSSTTSPKVTPTFDVAAGDIIVVLAQSENSSTIAAVTPSASGGSVTWTARSQFPAATSGNTALTRCWTGAVGANATGITVSLDRISAAADLWGFSATLVKSHGGVGQVFQGGITSGNGAPSVGVSCSANSLVLAACADWNAVDGTTRTWRTINGAPQSESAYFRQAGNYTAYEGYRTDTDGAGTVTQGLTTPSTMRWSLSGVEILGVTASSSGTIDPAVITLQGVTPNLSGSGSASAAIDPASLSLQGVTPGLSGSGSSSAQVDPATVSLQGVTPSLSGSGSVSAAIDPAVVTLEGVTPTLSAGGTTVQIDPAVISLQGVTPTLVGSGSASRAIDPATLTLQGQTPALSGSGTASRAIDTAVLTLSGQTPSLSGSGSALTSIDPAVVSLVGVTPSLSTGSPAGALPVYKGEDQIQGVYIGDQEILHRFKGDVQLW